MKRGEYGFTLIELLIVVAIIAILALIAVPNFLEAQTRAKVSRVKTDHRTLATAQEAYYVDWNSYTKFDKGGDDVLGTLDGWKQLTTPVAYITSVPNDPFGRSRTNPGTAQLSHAYYEIGTGDPGVGSAAADSSTASPMIRATHTFSMTGNGPDSLDQTDGGAQWDDNQFNWTEWNFPWVQFANNPAAALELTGLFYDPTNGTVSRGDIFRVGGTKPSGVVFDTLFALANRQ